MARRESKALAGFFATPPHLIGPIGATVRPDPARPGRVVVVDPCAGEGVALAGLVEAIQADSKVVAETRACEMERTRWEQLRASDPRRQWSHHAGHHLHGDFFHVRFTPGMADVLYLNPPYDQDRDFRRLEARWLDRCAPILYGGGVLVFVIPHYALAACAATMALHFQDVRAYRFPDADFVAFKQVVVLARKTERTAPDPDVAAYCARVAADPIAAHGDLLGVVAGSYAPPIRDPDSSSGHHRYGARVDREDWVMAGFDVAGVAAMPPWESERGPLPDLAHPVDLVERAAAVYEVVNPPRPVHLASALAAGVFNGLRVYPNPGVQGPPLLVKGTFRRRWEQVEEKHNKDGEVTSETQIEKPELEVWVLDLTRATYHRLAATADLSGDVDVPVHAMTFADLLDRYGVSMLAALRAACPVLHDPSRDPEPRLEELGRDLWGPQTSMVHALDKLTARPGRGGLVVGEVGTGKTSIALALAKARNVRRALVWCPPHLLGSWAAQIAVVRPDARVVVLGSVSEVEALRDDPGPVVALLSREAAKLGHGWRAIAAPSGRALACPRCGRIVDAEDLAEKRTRCASSPLVARTQIGRWVLAHIHLMVRVDPQNPSVAALVAGTQAGQRFLAYARRVPATQAHRDALTAAVQDLYGMLVDHAEARDRTATALAWAFPTTARTGLDAFPAYQKSPDRNREYMLVREGIGLACPYPPDLGLHPEEHPGYTWAHDGSRYGVRTAEECWRPFVEAWRYLRGLWTPKPDPTQPHYTPTSPPHFYRYGSGHNQDGLGFSREGLQGHALGSRGAVSLALTRVVAAAGLRRMTCGEPLFQATPSPRRFPLGTYIARRAPNLFDAVIVDEAHEAASESSAQGIVAARLAQMANRTGALLLYLTGSLVNGYADSAFHALRAVSPKFRAAFNHGDRERFVDRYGLRKRVLVYETGRSSVVRGAHSERVVAGTKKAGMAPGVLPTLLLEHLLGSAAIIHKADLDIGLPPQSEETAPLALTDDQAANLDALIETVKAAIAQTRFVAGCAGKLFGAFAHLLSYPDLAACGPYEVRWPDNVPDTRTRDFEVTAGGLVARVAGLDPNTLLPKERWILDTIRDQSEAGRGLLVLPSHVALLDRLAWVCDQAGVEAVVLRADKVPPARREAWIDRHLNTRRRRVLITNPTCVQTGLNNLVSLATAVWYENPDCKAIVYRQANGRIHRPGQTQPVRSVFPLYGHRLTEYGHRLLLHKVGVSLAVDGLDPDAVLEAAGVASEFSAGLNVGHQLYRMLVGVQTQDGPGKP